MNWKIVTLMMALAFFVTPKLALAAGLTMQIPAGAPIEGSFPCKESDDALCMTCKDASLGSFVCWMNGGDESEVVIDVTEPYLDFILTRDSTCPAPWRQASADEARSHWPTACDALFDEQVVGLANGGSMKGKAYFCEIQDVHRSQENGKTWVITDNLCVRAKN